MRSYMMRLFRLAIITSVVLAALYYFYPYRGMSSSFAIDHLEVYKSKHKLYAYSKDSQVRSFTISIGRNPIGAKQLEGDLKTPEGEYTITSKNANSEFHKSLLISYPNKKDKEAAARVGKPAGGDVEIHGLRGDYAFLKRFHRWKDWTNGCIALTNNEMDDLYSHVEVGTRIIIYP